MRFTWRGHYPLSWSHRPLPCWPLCLFAAVVIHLCLLSTEQQVCDLVTWLFVGGASVITAVIGSSESLYLTLLRFLIGQVCQEEEEETSKGLSDEKLPRRKKQHEFSSFTADRKSSWIFQENRKLLQHWAHCHLFWPFVLEVLLHALWL